ERQGRYRPRMAPPPSHRLPRRSVPKLERVRLIGIVTARRQPSTVGRERHGPRFVAMTGKADFLVRVLPIELPESDRVPTVEQQCPAVGGEAKAIGTFEPAREFGNLPPG